MNEKTLIATVGLPRSGKSTWARQQNVPIVNPDSIRIALHGQRFAASAEPFVWAIAKTMVRALFLAGTDTVILDSTCNTRKRRDEWQSPQWSTRFKVFDASEALCIRRALNEKDDEIIPIIKKMAVELETLGVDEIEYDERPLL